MIIAAIFMEYLKLMTYDDITDWSEENIDIDMYDSFDDWVDDIRDNFSKSDHVLPSGVIDSLADSWRIRKEENPNQESINIQKRINRKLQNQQRVQYLKEELAIKFKRQERRIQLAKKQQKQPEFKESKRKQHRKKRPRFTSRLSKKERSKRGKRK